MKSFLYGNGLVHTRVLDEGYRLSATQAPFTNQALSYLPNSNRLDVLNSASVTHDGMGNVTALGTRSMTYGANGRLASLTDSDTVTTLNAIYNGQGELARTVHNMVDGCVAPSLFRTIQK